MRKYSIGKYNTQSKKCENSWIEISESDAPDGPNKLLQKRDFDDYPDQQTPIQNKTNKLTRRSSNKLGKFCGTLYNFWNSYYSTKKYVTINYYYFLNKQANNNEENKIDDTFEFEISFYNKNHLSPHTFSKQKYQTNSTQKLTNLNTGLNVDDTKCAYFFTNCTNQKYDACLISSPGYPGVYLKNLKCQYFIKNDLNSKISLLNQKLILINDNLQVDGKLCHFESTPQSSASHLATSYFCDNGPRNLNLCSDHINVYDGVNLNSKGNSQPSTLLMKKVCGMGRLPKIVSKKNALVVELVSASDGLFANTGFLFYAMNQKQYFDYYSFFNQFDKNEVKNQHEFNSIKAIEKLQVENCNSDMNNCFININEDILPQIYAPEKRKKYQNPITTNTSSKNEDAFKIGYLYGLNQYQTNEFTLRYLIRTKRFNTIAVYLDKYQPSFNMETLAKLNGSNETLNKCSLNYLTIETTNFVVNQYEEDYDDEQFIVNDSGDFLFPRTKFKSNSNSNKNLASFKFKYDNFGDGQRNSLAKLCEPNDINNVTNRFFLIKTSNMNDYNKKSQSKTGLRNTNVLITYFSRNQSLTQTSKLLDFKVTFEFIDFDWHTYQSNTICDFLYNLNLDDSLPMHGTIKNPKGKKSCFIFDAFY